MGECNHSHAHSLVMANGSSECSCSCVLVCPTQTQSVENKQNWSVKGAHDIAMQGFIPITSHTNLHSFLASIHQCEWFTNHSKHIHAITPITRRAAAKLPPHFFHIPWFLNPCFLGKMQGKPPKSTLSQLFYWAYRSVTKCTNKCKLFATSQSEGLIARRFCSQNNIGAERSKLATIWTRSRYIISIATDKPLATMWFAIAHRNKNSRRFGAHQCPE